MVFLNGSKSHATAKLAYVINQSPNPFGPISNPPAFEVIYVSKFESSGFPIRKVSFLAFIHSIHSDRVETIIKNVLSCQSDRFAKDQNDRVQGNLPCF